MLLWGRIELLRETVVVRHSGRGRRLGVTLKITSDWTTVGLPRLGFRWLKRGR